MDKKCGIGTGRRLSLVGIFEIPGVDRLIMLTDPGINPELFTGDKADSGLDIINNAIDAVGKDGDIKINSFLMNQNHLQVDIVDNGPGMPPEVLSKIFEPFFTTKTGTEQQGTGLGLSITYGLVKKLGGEIYVDSTVGNGSTFTLVFPIIAEQRGDALQ